MASRSTISCLTRRTAASLCAASYRRTCRTASASARRNRARLRLRNNGDLLDRRRLLIVVEDVVAGIEDAATRRLLLLAAVVDGRRQGPARPSGGRALAAIGAAGELPRMRQAPVLPPPRAPLPRALGAVPLRPLHLRAEDRGARRRVAAANPAASPPAAAGASHAVEVELADARMRRQLHSDFSSESRGGRQQSGGGE